MRNAKIEKVSQKQVVFEEEQSLKYIVIVLEGKLAVARKSTNEEGENDHIITNNSHEKEELYERLTLQAKK
jgi:hypothetical protein